MQLGIAFSTVLWAGLLSFEVLAFQYGQHFPNGQAAVEHIYGSSAGTWKQMTPINYVWNYYEQYGTSNHPYDKGALITAADGTAFYTTRDANGHLLCDHDHDLEIDADLVQNCGFAFHEHAGIGVNGSRRGAPFTNFWLDDNWLARYMSQAYGRPEPSGLSDHSTFMRWKPIGRDPSNWVLYNSMHFDTLALDGLYFIAVGNLENAVRNWDTSLSMSGATYNSETQEYDYPNIEENYHVGLFKILTEHLLTHAADFLGPDKRVTLLQHSISLRAHILAHQQLDFGIATLLGWTSHVEGGSSLINTESVSCNVLALGAGAQFVVEAVGSSSSSDGAKYVNSVQLTLPAADGTRQTAEFLLRVNSAASTGVNLGKVEIWDGADLLASLTFSREDFNGNDLWTKIPVSFEVSGGGNRLIDLAVYSLGAPDTRLDSSIVRVL